MNGEHLEGYGQFSRREVPVDQEPVEHVIEAGHGVRPGQAMVQRPGRRYGHLWEPAVVVAHWETQEAGSAGLRTCLTVLRCPPDPWAVGGMAQSQIRYVVVLWEAGSERMALCRELGMNPGLGVEVFAMGILEHVTTDEAGRTVGHAFAGMVARGELAFPPETEREHGEWRGAAVSAARTA